MGVFKSPYDPKEYRTIRLENGIVALLISDPRTQPSNTRRRRRRLSSYCEEVDVGVSEGEEEDGDSDGESSGSDGDDCSVGERGLSDEERDVTNGEDTNPIRSACAVCVGVGSFSDPPDIPGLVHLLEHMVFMGSKKYPGENTFDVLTNRHGGHDNASTDYEKTVFEFTIHKAYFREALDMFAHFFASPLLDKSSLNREIEAVDSEFQTSIQSDEDRVQQLLCSIAIPDHPFAKFVWGNNESLKKMPKEKNINVAKHLKEFYQRMYSSHYMTVAVMSCDTLDSLEEWVRESFSAVPHNHLLAPTFNDTSPVFDDRTFHKLYKVVPVKDTHEIQLTWVLPCLFDKYRTKPLHYLGWLLGHEGEGSVLSLLKKRNLATAICAGNSGLGYEYNSCFSLFTCSLTLTDKGFDAIFECLTVIFQYLQLLREVGPQESIYKEIQTIGENEFNFKEEEEPINYVETLCESMQYYPEEDFLTGNDLMFEYNSEVIASVQSRLTPDQANIMLLSQRFTADCTEKEKWFGTLYSSEEISSEWMQSWKNLELHPELHLPSPNVFIATDFTLKESDVPTSKYPVVVEECDRYKLWFRKDEQFKTPRAWIYLLFKTHVHLQSPESAALVELFLHLLGINVAEIAYAADVAQLEYSTNVVTRGITLTFNGLNHKLPLLFENLIDHIASFSTTEDNFAMAKEGVKRAYSNSVLKPKKVCKSSRLKVLEYQYWITAEKLAVIDNVTLKSLENFVVKLKKELFVEALVQGNMTAQDGKDLMTYLCSHLDFTPLPSSFHMKPRTLQLPSNTHVSYQLMNKDNQSPDTVITDYYQCSLGTRRDSAMSNFLARIMEEPCFDTLRTKQQLGYEVYSTHHSTNGVVGLSVTVVTQGSKFSVAHASSCMDQFVREFSDVVHSWTLEEFRTQVDALIQEKLEPDIALEDEVTRNWAEIILEHYHFDRLEREAEELRTLTQEEACSWLHRYTHPGEHYRKFSIKVVSHITEGGNAKEDSDKVQESSVDPGEKTGSSVDPGVKMESSVDSGAKTESSVDPGEKTESSVDRGEKTESLVDSGAKTESSVDPGEKTESSVDPGAKTESLVDPGKKTESLVDSGAKTESSVDPGEKTESSVDPGEKTESSVDPGAKTESSVDALTPEYIVLTERDVDAFKDTLLVYPSCGSPSNKHYL